MPINLKYDSPDNGNCRVYYRNGRRLFCFQIADYRAKTFELLTCSRDGEPECPVNMAAIGNVALPGDMDESICRELAEFMVSRAWRDINRAYTR